MTTGRSGDGAGAQGGTAPLENATLRSSLQLPRSGERCQGPRPAFPGWGGPLGRGAHWTLLAALRAYRGGETRKAGWQVAPVSHTGSHWCCEEHTGATHDLLLTTFGTRGEKQGA